MAWKDSLTASINADGFEVSGLVVFATVPYASTTAKLYDQRQDGRVPCQSSRLVRAQPASRFDGFWSFPGIGRFDNLRGIAASIKTLDILNSYQAGRNAPFNALLRSAEALSKFQGATRRRVCVQAHEIQRRVLTIIVPAGDLSKLKPEIMAQSYRFLRISAWHPAIEGISATHPSGWFR